MAQARLTLTVCLGARTEFRRALLQKGYTFTEDKGWFTSQFVVTGSVSEMTILHRAVKAYAAA